MRSFAATHPEVEAMNLQAAPSYEFIPAFTWPEFREQLHDRLASPDVQPSSLLVSVPLITCAEAGGHQPSHSTVMHRVIEVQTLSTRRDITIALGTLIFPDIPPGVDRQTSFPLQPRPGTVMIRNGLRVGQTPESEVGPLVTYTDGLAAAQSLDRIFTRGL